MGAAFVRKPTACALIALTFLTACTETPAPAPVATAGGKPSGENADYALRFPQANIERCASLYLFLGGSEAVFGSRSSTQIYADKFAVSMAMAAVRTYKAKPLTQAELEPIGNRVQSIYRQYDTRIARSRDGSPQWKSDASFVRDLGYCEAMLAPLWKSIT
jgi:hypothetical protein